MNWSNKLLDNTLPTPQKRRYAITYIFRNLKIKNIKPLYLLFYFCKFVSYPKTRNESGMQRAER